MRGKFAEFDPKKVSWIRIDECTFRQQALTAVTNQCQLNVSLQNKSQSMIDYMIFLKLNLFIRFRLYNLPVPVNESSLWK